MKRHPILMLVMLAGFLAVLATVPAFASTPDGETPAEEDVCELESGAAFGLCNAYCEAMDCELRDDGDPNTHPRASVTACLRVKDRYMQVTGNESLPCEVFDECPPGEGGEDCPCDVNDDCASDFFCSEDDGVCVPL